MTDVAQPAVFIKTFGCQMNERDSQAMEVLLGRAGFTTTASPEQADLILFNTCTIRDKAYNRAMSDIGRAVLHKNRPGVQIGVCGCAASQAKEQLLHRFPHVDFIVGPDQIAQLPEIVQQTAQGSRSAAVELVDDAGSYVFVDGVSDERAQSGTALVTIMKGCNYACSYCIVPSVRGKEVCRPAGDIIAEIRHLVERNIKEVVLLGQNVADYKSKEEASGKVQKLGWLLKSIAAETDVLRLRFISPHPRDIDDELIDAYKKLDVVCPHIHLPVQSGSNRVLKQMRRGYTRERYLELVDKLREARPGIAVTTDLIVGFPTETPDEFAETMDLVRRVEFDNIFAFAYSPRPGTYAATFLHDDVPKATKKRHLAELLDVQRDISRRKNEACVGRRCQVLVEGSDMMKRGRMAGRTEDNRIVNFDSVPTLVGEVVPMRITQAFTNSLEGEILHE